MLKKVIKHSDLDGNPTETTCYFNLTKAEAIEINIRTDLEVVGQTKDTNVIMDVFKRILQMSYGKRTVNGEFIKEGFPAFAASEAYSELFMEIWQNPGYASEFIKGILPAGILPEEEGVQQTQSNIPEHMRNHPSMQSHLQKKPASAGTFDRAAHDPQESQFTVPGARSDSVVAPQADVVDPAVDKSYQEYLAYKAEMAARAPIAPSERVSPPEASQQFTPPKAELI